jgi:5-methylcytosine-specific restriction endonuclease McrA
MNDKRNPMRRVECACGVSKDGEHANWTMTMAEPTGPSALVGTCVGCGDQRNARCTCGGEVFESTLAPANQRRAVCTLCGTWYGPICHKVRRRQRRAVMVQKQHAGIVGSDILERPPPKCARCGAIDVPLELDHVRPLGRGGHDSVLNTRALCRACHDAATKTAFRKG